MSLPHIPNGAAQLDLSAAMEEVYADQARSAKFGTPICVNERLNGKLVQRFHGTNHVDILHQPRSEERAPEPLSKDARVSKDGHKRDRARGHPSRRPREERGLLRMRSEV